MTREEWPINPFRKGSRVWNIMEMAIQEQFDGLPGISDLTLHDIADLLDAAYYEISADIYKIKIKTGYIVPHVKMPGGRKKRK